MLRLSDIARKMLRRGATDRPKDPFRTRLGLDSLEDRVVPATVTAATIDDALEGFASGTIRLARDGSTTNPLLVSFAISGAAVRGTDYDLTSSEIIGMNEEQTIFSVTIPSGLASVDLSVDTIDDGVAEFDESVVITILSGSYTIGSPDAATVIIRDNETPIVTVQKMGDTAEGSSNLFRFVRQGDKSGTLTVNYSIGGTADSGDDFTALSGSVVFAAGEVSADVEIEALHDEEYDPGETVTLTIGSGTGYTIGGEDEAEITIDDDAAMTFTADSNQGVIWYNIPWEEVDPEEASQSLELTDFVFKFAGQTFTEKDADATPTVQFEDGEFVGITFDIDTSAIGSYAYSAIAISGLDVTIEPDVGDPIFVVAPPERTKLAIDLSGAGMNPVAYNLTVKVSYQMGPTVEVTFNVPANTNAGLLRDLVLGALEDKGVDVKPTASDRLLVAGKKNDQLVRVQFDGTAIQQLNLIKAAPLAVPPLTPKLNINGADK